MIFLLLFMFVVVIYLVAKNLGAKNEYKTSLNTIESYEVVDDLSTTWEVSFTDMLAFWKLSSIFLEKNRLFELKRTPEGAWLIRLTYESRAKELKNLSSLKESKFKSVHPSDKDVEEVSSNEWQSFEAFTQIETAYQKWLRDGYSVSLSHHWKRLESKEDISR